MSASLVAVGSDGAQISRGLSAQRSDTQLATDFQQSLACALESLTIRDVDPPGPRQDAAATLHRAGETSPASTAQARDGKQVAQNARAPSQLGPGLRPTATVRSGASQRSMVATATTPLAVGLYQPLQTSTITVLDRLRQRNEVIAQRLAVAPGSTLATQRLATPIASPARPQASRPVDIPAGRPLTLADYPRPPEDNGRGMHWIPTLRSDKSTVDRFVREMVDMKIKWAVILNDDCNIGDNDYLVQQLVANGIMPIMRIYTPNGEPIKGDLQALVRHYKPMGVSYYQLYNEPNLNSENEGRAPDVNRYVDLWAAAARAVTEAGGLPGFGSLAPGGNFDDVEFLKQSLDTLKARGEMGLLDRAWLGVHNYTLNHPLDYAKDSNGFLKFRWYDEIVRQKLGRSLPIISTEGGTHVGVDCDKTMPPVTEEKQVEMVVGAYDYMRNAEPYYLAYTYWVIANGAGGGADKGFEWQALFGNGKTSPVVAALKKMDDGVRSIPTAARLISSPNPGQTIVDEAMKYVGKRYVWGGHSPSGFDCTGLTWYVMKQLGHSLPQHDLEGQMASGRSVKRSELRPGDFVFFRDTYRSGLSHVGIYAGGNRFIHAASEREGVIVSSLEEPYWNSRYLGATRVLP